MHKTNKEMRDDKEALTLQETQQIALEILHTVAEICEKLELRYYLVYGTLIGAVRHHGFIPWDDDVDIMMPRPDHDKLMEYLEEHIGEYPHLKVFNSKTSQIVRLCINTHSHYGHSNQCKNFLHKHFCFSL